MIQLFLARSTSDARDVIVEPDKEWLATKLRICQQGDAHARQQAWEEIAHYLMPYLLQVAVQEQRRSWFKTHSLHFAEDAAADAFLGLFTKVEQLTRPEGVMGWLRIAIRHRFMEWAGRTFYGHEAPTGEAKLLDTQYQSRLKVLTANSTLYAAIRQLPEHHRWLLFEVYWLDTMIKTIGARRSVSAEAVGGTLKRIYKKLRTYIIAQGCSAADLEADTGEG